MADEPTTQTVVDPVPTFRTMRKRSPWHWIIEYNPCYLLSAVCMLTGTLLLTNTLDWSPTPLSRLLPMLGLLQVYELCCVVLGVALYRRIGPRRDAVELIALVMLFSADVSFLMSEFATDHFAIGTAVSLTLFVLAVVKLAIIARGLRLNLGANTIAFAIAGFAFLYGIPPLLNLIDDGGVMNGGGVMVAHFYGLWWIVGLAPLAWRLTHKVGEVPGWVKAAAVVPWVSFAAHVGILHYVYDRPFHAPMATPLVLALMLMDRQPFVTFPKILGLAVAGVFTLPTTAQLNFDAGPITVTPLLVGLSGVYLALFYTSFVKWLPHAAIAGLGVLGVRLFGPSGETILGWWRESWQFAWSRRPATRFAWGVIATAGAFGLLAIGALFSFRPQRDDASRSSPNNLAKSAGL
ncbi:MAG: hypothetical protein AAGD32_11975 [Planctomycetota bacterium]